MGRRTPLYDTHRGLGAKVVEFAGWDMPVSYAGAQAEHHMVRRHCGLFDVSHMGEVELRGRGAAAACQRLTVNDVSKLVDGRAQYSVLCDERGGVLDDLIVYRLAAERYLLVVNASNREADVEWIRAHVPSDVEVVDRSDELGLIAVQGPAAKEVLGGLAPGATVLGSFGVTPATLAGHDVMVARTGYTGEDGFEVFVDAGEAVAVWTTLLDAAAARDGGPAGLAARDTLRLEAALPLCGTDMDRTTTPLEAGLGWVVKLDSGDFIGAQALAAQRASGVPRRLIGIELDGAAVPRHGYPVWHDGAHVGEVTSGARSPTLGTTIGMAMVASRATPTGTRLEIEIRGRRVPAMVVDRPFYRRST
jgi:aminomethyltransferase